MCYSAGMMTVAYIGSLPQWMVLFAVCLLIFGAKRLPEIARGLGRALGEFKNARREFEEELSQSLDASDKEERGKGGEEERRG